MKKKFFWRVCWVFALGLIACCGEEKVLFSVSPQKITLNDGTASVTITSVSDTAEWHVVTTSDNWLETTPSQGRGSGTMRLSALNDNKTDKDRTATVAISSSISSEMYYIQVTQQPSPSRLELDQNTLAFSNAEGEETIVITSNIKWTATSDKDWCMVSPRSGSDNGSLRVTIAENITTDERTATITISDDENRLDSKYVTVSQLAAPRKLIAEQESLSFTCAEGKASLNIISNLSWNAVSDKSWCTLTRNEGINDGTIEVAVTKNEGATSRTAVITLTATDGSVDPFVVKVVQQAEAKPGEDDNVAPKYSRTK